MQTLHRSILSALMGFAFLGAQTPIPVPEQFMALAPQPGLSRPTPLALVLVFQGYAPVVLPASRQVCVVWGDGALKLLPAYYEKEGAYEKADKARNAWTYGAAGAETLPGVLIKLPWCIIDTITPPEIPGVADDSALAAQETLSARRRPRLLQVIFTFRGAPPLMVDATQCQGVFWGEGGMDVLSGGLEAQGLGERAQRVRALWSAGINGALPGVVTAAP